MKEKLINEDVSQANDVEETEATEALETNGEANLSASDGEQPENAEVIRHQEDNISDKDLPPDVTEEPQDSEQMDLRKIEGYPKWVKAYLNVSDDEGHLLGDNGQESEVKKLCKDLDSMDLSLEEDPDLWVNRIKDLVLRYNSAINVRENTSAGVFTKYRIRLGMLFNFQKELVKNRLNRKWTEWFPENYPSISLRSAQEYMKIAEYPGVIRYAVFGKQRLLQIANRIGKPKGDDQIEKFLEENGIDFNPEAEADYEELKTVTDIAIARKKLNSEGLEEVPDDKVEALIRNGIEITPFRLVQMKLVKEAHENLTDHIGQLIAKRGKVEPIQTPRTKAESFKKTLDLFIDRTTDAIEDVEYLGQVDLGLCGQLKEKILALEEKIASMTN